MSSIVRTGGSNIDRSADLRGLSTDTKPTRANGNNVPHGSTWYNMDDCTKYMYNENDDTWYNIPNGGGGGGTGDMQKSVYDPTNTVANAGGIDTYVETEISDAKSEIITEVEGDIAPIANNLINDTVGWTNKNLLPITLDQLKAINTSGTWEDNVYTYRGITITVDIFNNLITGINVNGANTTGSVVFKLTDNFVYQFLSEDKYYISDDVDTTAIVSGSAYISVERKKGESGESHYLSTNNEERSTKFTVDYSIYDYYFVNIYIPNNSSINNAVFYPMIRRASISDDTYEPYTKTVKDEIFNLNSSVGNLKSRVGIVEGNIQTLNEIKANKSDLGTASTKNSTSVVTDSTDLVESGAVKDIVGWGNKNLSIPYKYTITVSDFTITYENNKVVANGETGNTDVIYPVSSVARNNGYAFDLPAGTYTVSLTGDTANLEPQIVKSNGAVLEGTTITLDTLTTVFLRVMVKKNNTFNNQICYIQLEKGSTATSYEPYHESVEDYCASKQLLEDTVGWISDEQAKLYNWTGDSTGITFTYTNEQLTVNGTALANTSQPSSANVPEDGKYTLKAGSYKLISDVDNVYWEVLSLNPVAFITQDSKPFTITEDTAVFIRANIKSGTSFNNKVVHVSLRKLSVDEQKCDNSVIGTVEDRTNPTKPYAVGEHFIRNGKFCTCTVAVTTSSTWTLGSNYVEGDIAQFTSLLFAGTIADIVARLPIDNMSINCIIGSQLLLQLTSNAVNHTAFITVFKRGSEYTWYGKAAGADNEFCLGTFTANGYSNHRVI